MINKDYIMRLIEQLNLVLSRLLFKKDTAEYSEILDELTASYATITGVDPQFINNLSTESLIEFLRPGGRYEAEKSMIIGRLLYEEALINRLTNEDADFISGKIEKALNLIVEACNENPELTFASENADLILKDFSALSSKKNTRIRLYRFYETSGNYSRGEDILYSLIEDGYAEIKDEIINYYKRLKDKTDDELIKGGLPREEINEGLEKILSSNLLPPK